MRREPLGETGLSVTPIGLGLAALGRPGYLDLGRAEDLGEDRRIETMERRAHEVLDAAYAVGIRYVDAARSYGRAEAFLASWLEARGLAPADVTVGSKWGYAYTAGWRADAGVHEVKDHSLAALRRQVAESRELLGRALALYQIHSATLDSGVLEDRAVLEALATLREEGLAIGASVSGPRQPEVVRRAMEVEVAGDGLFGAVQATWNPLEPSAGDALAEAHRAGRGVLVKEAMANGRLGPRGRGRHREVLDRIAETHRVGIDAVVLAAAVANPWADVVLSGAVTPAQVRSNAAGADLNLDDRELADLAGFAEPPEVYWRRRSELAWT